jgi:DNA-binding FrmR family transcriptional regulator
MKIKNRIHLLTELEFPFKRPCASHRQQILAVRLRRVEGLMETVKNMSEEEAQNYITQLETVAKQISENVHG